MLWRTRSLSSASPSPPFSSSGRAGRRPGRRVAREARGAALQGGGLGPRAGQFVGLDFLRKTNADGQISAWLAKKHGEPDETWEDFAVRYRAQSEKVVAAECVSRLNDRRYGQWLTLHKPFRRCLDLVDEAQLAKVPPQYRYLAMAHLNGYGADDAEVDRELKVEGHSRSAEHQGHACGQPGSDSGLPCRKEAS